MTSTMQLFRKLLLNGGKCEVLEADTADAQRLVDAELALWSRERYGVVIILLSQRIRPLLKELQELVQ